MKYIHTEFGWTFERGPTGVYFDSEETAFHGSNFHNVELKNIMEDVLKDGRDKITDNDLKGKY